MSNRIPTATKIQAIDVHGFALAADFPGWGAENYKDFFVEVPAGLTGTVVSTESHGMAPFTRLVIKWENGSRSAGVDPREVRAI